MGPDKKTRGATLKPIAPYFLAVFACFFSQGGIRQAQAHELVLPVLEYRLGPFAPVGIPRWNGYIDYLTLLNERDGGINGVKIRIVRCETGYDTNRSIECYEKLKKEALIFLPGSTPVAYHLIDRANADKVPSLTAGYGRSSAADGRIFKWTFNFPATYWSTPSIAIKYIADQGRGTKRLEGKKIGLVHLNNAAGKEPVPVLAGLAKREGFELLLYPIDLPGLDQKAIWQRIREDRPDWLLLWGYGRLTQVALREAVDSQFPMDHVIGNAWSASENDIQDLRVEANGYLGIALRAPGAVCPVHDDIVKYVYDSGKALDPGFRPRIGEVLYNQGLAEAMWAAEGIANAMRISKRKEVNAEDVRDGLEALDITEERLDVLGFEGMLSPLKVTCANHEGVPKAAIQQWDAAGQRWRLVSRFYEPHYDLVAPLIKADAESYAKEKGIEPRICQ
jgi:branched-chain amino acid transport system substrate-binding protein